MIIWEISFIKQNFLIFDPIILTTYFVYDVLNFNLLYLDLTQPLNQIDAFIFYLFVSIWFCSESYTTHTLNALFGLYLSLFLFNVTHYEQI